MQEKRFGEIQKYLREHEICTYEELCSHCDVSLSTIKRDVQYLAKQGLILQIRGGVQIPQTQKKLVPRPAPVKQLHYEQHLDRIAKKASEFVTDNDIVFLGSGVTVAHMVRHMRGHKDLTIITNSIYVMQEAFQYDIDVMMIGGMLNRTTMSYIGIQSINQLRDLNANIAFMSCNGVSLPRGITNSSEVEGDVKKVAIQISGRSVLLADNRKFDQISLYTIAQMGDFSMLITDKPLDERYLNEAASTNTKLLIAEE